MAVVVVAIWGGQCRWTTIAWTDGGSRLDNILLAHFISMRSVTFWSRFLIVVRSNARRVFFNHNFELRENQNTLILCDPLSCMFSLVIFQSGHQSPVPRHSYELNRRTISPKLPKSIWDYFLEGSADEFNQCSLPRTRNVHKPDLRRGHFFDYWFSAIYGVLVRFTSPHRHLKQICSASHTHIRPANINNCPKQMLAAVIQRDQRLPFFRPFSVSTPAILYPCLLLFLFGRLVSSSVVEENDRKDI